MLLDQCCLFFLKKYFVLKSFSFFSKIGKYLLDPTEFAGVVASSTFGVGREASNAIDGYKQVITFSKKKIF